MSQKCCCWSQEGEWGIGATCSTSPFPPEDEEEWKTAYAQLSSQRASCLHTPPHPTPPCISSCLLQQRGKWKSLNSPLPHQLSRSQLEASLALYEMIKLKPIRNRSSDQHSAHFQSIGVCSHVWISLKDGLCIMQQNLNYKIIPPTKIIWFLLVNYWVT